MLFEKVIAAVFIKLPRVLLPAVVLGCCVYQKLWCWQTEAATLWPYHPDMTAILFPSRCVVHRIIMSSLEWRATHHHDDDVSGRPTTCVTGVAVDRMHWPRYRQTDQTTQALTIRSSRSENPRNDVHPSVTILMASTGQVFSVCKLRESK